MFKTKVIIVPKGLERKIISFIKYSIEYNNLILPTELGHKKEDVVILKLSDKDIILSRCSGRVRGYCIDDKDPLELEDAHIQTLGTLSDEIDEELIKGFSITCEQPDEDYTKRVLTSFVQNCQKSQLTIMQRLNQYYLTSGTSDTDTISQFFATCEEIEKSHGFCAGLVSLWLYSCSQSSKRDSSDKVHDDITWFLSTIKTMGNLDKLTPEQKAEIERFFIHMKYFQNPTDITHDAFLGDLDVVIEDTKEKHPHKITSFGGLYTKEELEDIFDNNIQSGHMVYVVVLINLHEQKVPHSIGIMKNKDGSFEFYDPNLPVGHITLKNSYLTAHEFFATANNSDSSKKEVFGFKVFGWDNNSHTEYPNREDLMDEEYSPHLPQILTALGCPKLMSAYAAKFPQVANSRIANQFTPLQSMKHFALSIPFTKALLESKADPNTPDQSGRIPLHEAAKRGLFEHTELLLQYGSELDKPDNTESTPLYEAVRYGHLPTVQLLMSKGTDHHKKNKYNLSPLDEAKYKERNDMVAAMTLKTH